MKGALPQGQILSVALAARVRGWRRGMGGCQKPHRELGVSVTCHQQRPLPSCSSLTALTLPLTTQETSLSGAPWGRAIPRGPRFCPPPLPPPPPPSPLLHPLPTSLPGLPLLAAPLAVGADVYTPEMALLKMTFNQSWNYRADGCKPRNQSSEPPGAPGRGLAASSRRQSSARASHINPRGTPRS